MTIHELVELQREAAYTLMPRPVDERLDQLDTLRSAISIREDALCQALQMDLGKSREEAYMTEIGIVQSEISYIMRHLSRWAKPKRVLSPLTHFPAKSYIIKEPYGVVLIMSPWNYPFQLALNPFIGALAAGNHCVIKPSNYAPYTSQAIGDLISSCFPLEQAAVILGGRNENQALLDERFDYIFFTGGLKVGKTVLEKAARFATPVSLELGGKSPCIVDHTADIEIAARRIAFGKAINSGQTCVAPDYLLVQEKMRDKLVKAIADRWTEFYGDALKNPKWPKMINEKHYQRVMNLIAGEEVYCGGVGDGQRIAPTILLNVSWDAPIMQEEIFGPVLPVITFRDVEDVLPLINSREKPLALYLFTRSRATQDRILKKIPFGGGCVNDTVIHLASSRLPFGGVGQSGMGQYHGRFSFDTFTHEKSVVIRRNHPDIQMRYPPFTDKKLKWVKRFLR